MKILVFLVLLAGAAQAQYLIEPSAPGPVSTVAWSGTPSLEVYSGGQLFQVDSTSVLASNGTVLVGDFSYFGMVEGAIWMNGINNPAENLNELIAPGGNSGLAVAYSIDAQGDIWGKDVATFSAGPAPKDYKLTPSAPEISNAGAFGAFMLLAGLLAVIRGRRSV
jgi:hypothetical protein